MNQDALSYIGIAFNGSPLGTDIFDYFEGEILPLTSESLKT